MEQKSKHLEFIQSTIRQITSRTSLFRAWSVTLIAGLLMMTAIVSRDGMYFVVFFSALMFWVMEGHLLSQGCRLGALYEHVRRQGEGQIDFSMNTEPFRDRYTCLGAMFSKELLSYYGFLFLAIIIVALACAGAFT